MRDDNLVECGVPYKDPLLRKQKQREADLRRKQDPIRREHDLKYGRARAKLPQVKEAHHRAYRLRMQNPEYKAKRYRLNKAWASQNKERLRCIALKWRNEHIEEARARSREWERNNLDYRHRKRAEKLNATVNPKAVRKFMLDVRSKTHAVCYYCSKTVSTRLIHFDHIVPLSKGGAHRVENLCVACKACNHRKWAHLLKDFVRLGQQLLSL